MTRQPFFVITIGTALLGFLVGCRPQQPLFLFEDGDLSHYIGKATAIEYPDVEQPSLPDAAYAEAPLTISNPEPREYWDLSLEEAMRIALANGKFFRVLDRPDALLTNAQFAGSIYDPALAEANPRIGPEAALSAFDAQFSAGLTFEKNDTPQNSLSIGGLRIRPEAFQQDLGSFQAQLRKTMATGATWSLSHSIRYDLNNQPFRQHPSDWNVALEAQFTQPLLQGAGVTFNRIAGPGTIPGVYQGIVLARINTDVSLTEFESQVRDLVADVERAYWELYHSYRVLDAMNRALREATDTWQKVRVEFDSGKAASQDEGLARHQYYQFRNLAEQAQSNLFRREMALRHMLGLSPSDGRLIRPIDEPVSAKLIFDWNSTHAEALVRSVELRQQRWRIKQRELELVAAKNYLFPRLDLTGRYRWLGLGDELIDSQGGDPIPSNLDSDAYSSLMSGHFQEWHLGLQLTMPLGFRREMAAVRHAQLQLTRERALLQEQELDLVRLLAEAYRSIDENYVRAQTNFNRLLAAQRELEGYKEKERVGLPVRQAALNFILDSQRRVAEAEIDYYRALVDYSLAVVQFHRHKGSLLEYNGILLAEGPWPAKAYFDAYRRARARDAAFYLDYGFTEPAVFSRGVYDQNAGLHGGMMSERPPEPTPASEDSQTEPVKPEIIPTPPPEPRSQPELIPQARGMLHSAPQTMLAPAVSQGNRGQPLGRQPGSREGKAIVATGAHGPLPSQVTVSTQPNTGQPSGEAPVHSQQEGVRQASYDLANLDLTPLTTRARNSNGASPQNHANSRLPSGDSVTDESSTNYGFTASGGSKPNEVGTRSALPARSDPTAAGDGWRSARR